MPGRRFGLLLLVLLALLPSPTRAASDEVDLAILDGDINSVTAGYIGEVVDRAAAEHAAALVIAMNTPGGLSTAMDDIVTKLLNSPTAVIVYVSPAGGRAASAGLFVAQSADLVAMAPGTNIGSAHPIDASGANIGGDLGRKILNDAVARVRNLADIHGRNADWCEKAVRDSVNIGVGEAVDLHVADLEATSLQSLLATVDGRTLKRPHAADITLRTAGAAVVEMPMSLSEEMLHALIDPNVAFLLMLVAVFALIAEVSSPGAILPGVVGVIAAVLALVALANLPVTLAGVLLLLFAFALFIADIKAPTHGILTAGGLIAMLLGSTFLFSPGPVGLGIDPWVIVGSAGCVTLLFAFVVRKAVGARSRRSFSGAEALMGGVGEARGRLDPDGQVFVAGAVWPAVSDAGAIPSGTTVKVTGAVEGRLTVEPARALGVASKPDTVAPPEPEGPAVKGSPGS